MTRLLNKVAIITGAAQGIGRVTVFDPRQSADQPLAARPGAGAGWRLRR